MKIKKAALHLIEQPLLSPFVTSRGKVKMRESILVELEGENGETGWGEVVAFSSPWYTEETIKTCWHMITDFLLPIILHQKIDHPRDVWQLFQHIKRNHMAKAAIETAIWDVYAKEQDVSLATLLGGKKERIDAGVVVSITTIEKVIAKIEEHLQEGYKRIKIKIKPGQDYNVLKEIRKVFPKVPLMADANSSYTLDDIDKLKALEEFDLMMIEQPLGSDDIVDHAKLQKVLSTPICLDESIVTFDDARKAIELGSCQIINIKIGRVGGLFETIRIHDLCNDQNIPVWCGGMLETGISRAHNIAVATLPNFSIPGDISASSRYWEQDVILPEVIVEEGCIHVPKKPGIGFEVNRDVIQRLSKEYREFV